MSGPARPVPFRNRMSSGAPFSPLSSFGFFGRKAQRFGTPFYKSTTKFNSGCGWPAFYEGLPGAIDRSLDPDGRRIEITCAACSGHLGHVFRGQGFPMPTDERHYANSCSLPQISSYFSETGTSYVMSCGVR